MVVGKFFVIGLDRLGPADILLQKEVFVRQILLSESEENGKISVAYEGTLSRGLTAEELEEKLRSIQKKPTDEKAHKRWKGWFHNEK